MNDKQRILVVDDEPQITRVLRRGLMTHGYDVRAAADGRSALQMLGEWPPDLVVTDLSMPNMDGIELCRKLRSFSQLPIIVLSVRGEERTKVEALDAGADDYVTKPFGIEELLARRRRGGTRVPATRGTRGASQACEDDYPHACVGHFFSPSPTANLAGKREGRTLATEFIKGAGQVSPRPSLCV